MANTALVLGGGGAVGGAWMVGVLAGLAEAGVEVSGADVVIGTSAGAIFGSRLASGVTAAELYERQLAGADGIDLTVTLGQTARFLWAALGSRNPRRSVARLGRAALAARTVPESEVFDAVGTLLGDVRQWPERELRITAVDARTGNLEAFDASSGVTLLEAVAASCAVPVVWPPVSAGGRRWMDGGSRSTSNLHLARGHGRIVAIAPIPKAVGPHPSALRQAADLAAAGARVSLLAPDAAARCVMGRNMMDDSRRSAAARAGHAQAVALADSVAEVWHG
ncbi:patatin-like phospholipase family protein [Streptomyces sp. NPDC001530]|uniref:patatin-like phospholipase family protein n=1 Tax=Streptomyces sp. NPDC001530 TaxID=3364582 RepID=UPI00367EE022